MRSHPKYKINRNDTLESISKLFGVEEDAWRRYHNSMCRLDDIIKKILPPHLEEIYLLPELWGKEIYLNTIQKQDLVSGKIEKIKNSFGYDNTLLMKPCPEILYYGVVLALFNDDKVNTIKYEVSIRWIAKEHEKHFIEIAKVSKTYINDKYPNLIADELALETASVLYPLELIVTRKDGIIGINNFKEIQQRWESIRKKIKEYNEGEIIEKYLQLNDSVLNEESALLKSLNNDWFLHAYFNKIHQTYGVSYSFDNTISVPFIFDTKGISFRLQQRINKSIDEQGFIKIEQKGVARDERSKIDLESGLSYAKYNEEEKVTGNYYSQYILEPKYNTIESMMMSSTLYLSQIRKMSIVISRIKRKDYE